MLLTAGNTRKTTCSRISPEIPLQISPAIPLLAASPQPSQAIEISLVIRIHRQFLTGFDANFPLQAEEIATFNRG
jgi:hypothetical protein